MAELSPPAAATAKAPIASAPARVAAGTAGGSPHGTVQTTPGVVRVAHVQVPSGVTAGSAAHAARRVPSSRALRQSLKAGSVTPGAHSDRSGPASPGHHGARAPGGAPGVAALASRRSSGAHDEHEGAAMQHSGARVAAADDDDGDGDAGGLDLGAFFFNWSAAGFSYFTGPRVWADESLPGIADNSVSWRARLEVWLETSTGGKILDIVQVLLSLVSCIFYIYSTYTPEMPSEMLTADICFACCFAADYVMRFVAAKSKLTYIFKPYPVVDALTIIPVFIEAAGGTGEDRTRFDFLRMIRFLRVIRIFRLFKLLRVLRMHRVMRLSDAGVSRQIIRLVWTAVAIVFCAAGMFQIVENEDPEMSWSLPQYEDTLLVGDQYTFLESTYFVIVTVTTVGYGDIYPATLLGQVFVVILIIFTWVVIPQQSSRLVELIRRRPKHRGVFLASAEAPHVLVVGSFDAEAVRSFLDEMYHSVHGESSQQTRAVFMSQQPLTDELETIFSQRIYSNRVMFLQGSVFEDRDLKRAAAASAKAVFVLNSAFRGATPQLASVIDDRAAVLRVAAIRNASPHPEIFAELVSPEHKTQVLSSGGNHVMCAMELSVAMLAISAIAPGASTLVTNLFTSNDPPAETDWVAAESTSTRRGARVAPQSSYSASKTGSFRAVGARKARVAAAAFGQGLHHHSLWQQEYAFGSAMEVYAVRISARYDGVPFADAALDVYQRWGACLFAVKVPIQRHPTRRGRFARPGPSAQRGEGRGGASGAGGSFREGGAGAHATESKAGETKAMGGGRVSSFRSLDVLTVDEMSDEDLDEDEAAPAGESVEGNGWDTFGNLVGDGSGGAVPGVEQRSVVCLNPGYGLRLQAGDLGFVISLNESAAAAITRESMSGSLPPVARSKPSALVKESMLRDVGRSVSKAAPTAGGSSLAAQRSAQPTEHKRTEGPSSGEAHGSGGAGSGEVKAADDDEAAKVPETEDVAKRRAVDKSALRVGQAGTLGVLDADSVGVATPASAHKVYSDPWGEACVVDARRGGHDLRGHTIICAGDNIDRAPALVAAMREAPSDLWRDVLVLATHVAEAAWRPLAGLPRVFWKAGSALSHHDLELAGIATADSVVILASEGSTAPNGEGVAAEIMWRQRAREQSGDEKHLVDYATIMASYAVQSFDNWSLSVVCELAFPSNGKFLRVSAPPVGALTERQGTVTRWDARQAEAGAQGVGAKCARDSPTPNPRTSPAQLGAPTSDVEGGQGAHPIRRVATAGEHGPRVMLAPRGDDKSDARGPGTPTRDTAAEVTTAARHLVRVRSAHAGLTQRRAKSAGSAKGASVLVDPGVARQTSLPRPNPRETFGTRLTRGASRLVQGLLRKKDSARANAVTTRNAVGRPSLSPTWVAHDPLAHPERVLQRRLSSVDAIAAIDAPSTDDQDIEYESDSEALVSRPAGGREFFNLRSFSSGSFFSERMLDLLLLHAFNNRYIIAIIGALLRPGTGATSSNLDASGFRGAPPAESFAQAFLRQISVPPDLVGRTYDELMTELMQSRGALVLSLLRAPHGPAGSQHAYVYTNPRPQTVISAHDRVFCLIPDDLRTAVL